MKETRADGNVAGAHVPPDPATQQRGTKITAEDMNQVFQELLNLIDAAGIERSYTDLTQVLQAVQYQVDGIAGEIKMKASETVPPGWLECNGAEVSRITYARLFADIGTIWGAGNGVSTFNLPTTSGLFPRGWDHGAGRDPDAASRTDKDGVVVGDHVGTFQDDEFEDHSHASAWAGSDGRFGAAPDGAAAYYDRTSSAGTAASGSLSGNAGGAETRPRNFSVMFIIRY